MADFDAEEYPPAGPEEAEYDGIEAEEYAAAGPVEAQVNSLPAEEPQVGAASSAPTVTYNPLSGTLLQPNTVVAIDSLQGALSIIYVKLGTDPRRLLVFDGLEFQPPFVGSTILAIPGGFRYNVSHQSGWPTDTARFTTRVAGLGSTILY